MLERKDYLSSLNKAKKNGINSWTPDTWCSCWLPSQQWESLCWGKVSQRKPVSGKAAGPAPTGQVGNATPAQADRPVFPLRREAAQRKPGD